MVESRNGIDLAAYVKIFDSVVQVNDCWVLWISTKDFLGLLLSMLCQQEVAESVDIRRLTYRAYKRRGW